MSGHDLLCIIILGESKKNCLSQFMKLYPENLSLFRLSRNTRALWYFSHMDAEIVVHNRQNLDQFTGDLEVMVITCQFWKSGIVKIV